MKRGQDGNEMRKQCSRAVFFFFEAEHGPGSDTNCEHCTGRYLNTGLRPFWKIKRRDKVDTERVWMQLDGATSKTARESMAWLQEHFFGRLISLKGCAPHSADLSPLHVFSGVISRIEFTRSHGSQKPSRLPSQPKPPVCHPRWSIEPSVTRRPCGSCRS